jgi:hypothetical protein
MKRRQETSTGDSEVSTRRDEEGRDMGWIDHRTRGRSSKYRRLADIPFEFVG